MNLEMIQNKKIITDKINKIDYIKGKLLGTGGFAKCYEAIQIDNGSLYAVKVVPKKSVNEKRQRYKLLIQIKLHRSLKHKHIVDFKQAFEDHDNIYMLMQYCRNYTLKDLVKRRKRLTEFQTKKYIIQIVKAIIYIHQQNIIHRDLKLGNILINQLMEVKICDFGLSTKIRNQGVIKKTICGTPNYIAPEIIEEQGHSYEVDIWSVGVIMYTLLFGKPPYEDNTVQQTYQNIKSNRYMFPSSKSVSSAAKDLINKILILQPTNRLSLQQILQHEFLILPQTIPEHIPLSSLAVPPTNIDELIQNNAKFSKLNLQLSHQFDVYEENENSFALAKGRLRNDNSSKIISEQKDQKNHVNTKFIYCKQCFEYGDFIAYLLSNGVVGAYNKIKNLNLILQYGKQNYYIIFNGDEVHKNSLEEYQEDHEPYLQKLLHFKTFFVFKYSFFGLQDMYKHSEISSEHIFIRKHMIISNKQILIRLSNSVIQLCFADLTSLLLMSCEDENGIFSLDHKGKLNQINYIECKNIKLKKKIRRFSNILELLSNHKNQQEKQS